MTPRDDDHADPLPAFPAGVDPAAIRVRSASEYGKVHQRSSAHKLNGPLAIALLVFVALVPIPLGSNRPAFWLMWATVVGGLAFVYGAALLWRGAPLRFGLSRVRPELVGFLLLCAFLVVQILPIARWLPSGLTALDGVGISPMALSLDIGSSRLVLIQYFTFALLLFLVAQVAVNRRRARRMLFVIFLIIAVFAVGGLVSLTYLGDTLLGFEKQFYLGDATGTFINRNSFASFLSVGLAIGMPMLVELLGSRKDKSISRFISEFAVLVISLVVIAAALFATNSRLGMTSGVFGAAVGLGLSLVARKSSVRLSAVFLILVALAAGVVMSVFGNDLLERLIFQQGNDEGRATIYPVIWQAILQRPWFGYGAGSFASVFTAMQFPPISGELYWTYAHSTYLALWFELGVVAGCLPLLIVALLGWRALRSIGDKSSTTVSVAALATIAVFGLHSTIDFPLEIEANAFLFTVILALGAAGAISAQSSADT